MPRSSLPRSRLPTREPKSCVATNFEGATPLEIACALGVSIARVHQIRSAGEKRLREDLTVLALWHAHFGG